MNYISIVIFIFISSYSFSQDILKVFGGSQIDNGEVIIECVNNDVLIGGETTSFGSGGEDLIITRLTPAGQIIWSKTYGLSGNEQTQRLGLHEAKNGDILCSFRSYSLPGQQRSGVIMRLNSLGDIIWQKQVGIPKGDLEGTRGIIEHEDGSIYVGVGGNHMPFGSTDGVIMKLTSDGELIWSKLIGVTDNDHLWSLIALSNNEIMLNMNSARLGAGARSAVLVRMDENGNMLSQTLLSGSGADILSDVVYDPSFGYVVTGGTTSFGAGGSDAFIAKLDLDLNLQWFKTYGGSGYEHGSTVEIVDDNHFMMYMNTGATDKLLKQMAIVGVDGEGNTLYSKSIGDQYNQGISIYSSQALFYSQNQNKTFFTNHFGNANNTTNMLFGAIDGTPENYCVDIAFTEGTHKPTISPVNFNIQELGYVKDISLNTTNVINFIEEDLCLCPFSPPILSDTTILCSGVTLEYNLDPSYDYKWEPASSFSCSTCPNPTFTGNSTTPVTVTISKNGCTSTIEFTISVDFIVADILNKDTILCLDDDPLLLQATPVNGTWSGFTPTMNSGNTFFDPILNGVGNYLIYYTPIEACGLKDSMEITVEPVISSSFTLTDFCEGKENFATDITVPGGVFSFNPSVTDGATIDPATGAITDGVKETTYSIQYSPPGRCVVDSIKEVTVKANPEFNVSYIDPTCGNTDGQLTIDGLTSGGAYIVDYSFNGTLFGPQNLNANTNGEIIISNLSEGTYSNFEITGTNGCTSIDEKDIVLTEPVPPIITAPNDIDICIDEGVVLTANNPDGAIISWDNGVSDGVEFYPTALGSTTYTVTAIIDNCITTDEVEVHVHPLPVPSFLGDNLQGCDPHTVVFTNTTANSSSTCLWSFGDGNSDNNCNTTSHTYALSGFYDVTLTLTDEFGCTGTTTKKNYIDVIAMPIANFTANPLVINSENSDVNFTNESVNATQYIWDFGDGSPIENGFNASHSYKTDELGSFIVTLTASNDFGCVDTARIEIMVKEELIYYIPNSFTPNTDGFNEMFQPIFTSGYDPQEFKLLIFNRWGELIFESQNTEIGWDGSYGNSIVKDGIYVWTIEFKEKMTDKKHSNQGFVNVIR